MNLLAVSRITGNINPADSIASRISNNQNPADSISRISYDQNPTSYDYSGNMGCQVSKGWIQIIVCCDELSKSAAI